MKISVSQALEGKKVKSVKFIDKNTIEVVLEGKATLKEDVEYGCIRISGNALENDTDAFNLVIVKKATIDANTTSSASASGTYTATYSLSAGTFAENVTAEQIVIAPEATSFNIEITISLDGTSSVVVE